MSNETTATSITDLYPDIKLGVKDFPLYIHPDVSEDIKQAIAQFLLKTDFMGCEAEIYDPAYNELEAYLFSDLDDETRCDEASEALQYMFKPILE